MKKRVLIVDDSPLQLEMAREALAEAGFEVTTAKDFGELEDQQKGSKADLILMDVEMPELFGDDVAQILRQARGVSTPIYLFSNLDPSELEERAASAGIDGFISKRNGVIDLVRRVEMILIENGDGNTSD